MSGPASQPVAADRETPSGPRQELALLVAVAASSLGDGFRYAALPLVVTLQGASPVTLGALLAAGTAPFLLVGLISGAVADRADRVLLLRATEAVRGLSIGAFAVLLFLDAPSDVVLAAAFVVAVLMGLGESLTFPSLFALTPTVVPEERLRRFNGRSAAAQTLGRDFVGPLIGAALVVTVSGWPFLIDAITFAVAFVLFGVVAAPERERRARVARTRAETGVVATGVLREVRDGLAWLVRQRLLLVFIVASALINLGNMGFLATEAVYVLRGLDAPAAGLGITMAAAASGAVVVAAGCDRLLGERPTLTVVPWGPVVIGVGMLVLAAAPSLLVATAGAALTGGGFALYNVAVTTTRQELTPDEWRGRADSSYRFVAWGVLPLGSLLGGVLSSTVGPRAPAAFTGVLCLVTAVGLAVALARFKASSR